MAVPRIACLVLLAGCASGPAASPEALLSESLAASRASLRAIQGGPAPATPAPMPIAVTPQAAPPPLRLGAAPAAASEFMHATPDAVRAALGEPALRRPEGSAEVWLYEAPRCRLDLVFYREGAALQVAHAAARAVGIEPQTEADCLRAIAGGRAAPRSGTTRA